MSGGPVARWMRLARWTRMTQICRELSVLRDAHVLRECCVLCIHAFEANSRLMPRVEKSELWHQFGGELTNLEPACCCHVVK